MNLKLVPRTKPPDGRSITVHLRINAKPLRRKLKKKEPKMMLPKLLLKNPAAMLAKPILRLPLRF